MRYEEKGVRKIIPTKAVLEDNRMACEPSVMGVLDRGRDVIYPRAFTRRRDTLKDFLASGFIPVGHDWEGLPVGYPVSAKEVGNKLVSEMAFHSTQAAQDARTVAKERIDAGKSVGLSIGFLPDYREGVHYFDNGSQLLEHADSLGCDMSLFDHKAISACKGTCRGLSIIDALYEFSVVSVPMNPMAQATDVKGGAWDEDESDLSESRVLRGSVTHRQILSERDFERFLREAGYSRRSARDITLFGYSKGLQREAGQITETPSDPPPNPDEKSENGEGDSPPETPAPAEPDPPQASEEEAPQTAVSVTSGFDPDAERKFYRLTTLTERLRLASLLELPRNENAIEGDAGRV